MEYSIDKIRRLQAKVKELNMEIMRNSVDIVTHMPPEILGAVQSGVVKFDFPVPPGMLKEIKNGNFKF